MNVIIVEDSKIIRDAFKALLMEYPEIIIVDTDDISVAFHAAQTVQTDYFILNIDMPKGSGLKLLKNIKNNNLGGKVIMLTYHSDNDYLKLAKHLGADYFFDKYTEFDNVIDLLTANLPVTVTY